MTSVALQFPAQEGRLKFPSGLPDAGILVGWSMEAEHIRQPIGFSFGDPAETPANGYVDPILMEAEGHLLTIAPTGAGKGVSCIIPALLRHNGPVIVIDPKGENTAVTARCRRERGESVVVLDPMGVTDEVPGGFNPLDLVTSDSRAAVDEALALATALLPDETSDRNLFWVSRARQLLLGIILHVTTDLPKDKHTLTEVRRIVHKLTVDPLSVADALSKSDHPEARMIEGALKIGASDTLGGILAFAQEGIDFVRGAQIQSVLETSTFDIDDIVRGGATSIYIVMPPHMLQSHGRVLRLWISALIQLILRRRRRPANSTLFILDEAAQLGTLQQLQTAITLLRGYGLQTWSFWQDVSQLRQLYPLDWETMVNNCRVVQAFGANNISAANAMADLVAGLSGSQFLEMERGEMLLQIAGDASVIARLPNYLRDPVFAGQFDENPFFAKDDGAPPSPDLNRSYVRRERRIHIGRPGEFRANAIDALIAAMIAREIGGAA